MREVIISCQQPVETRSYPRDVPSPNYFRSHKIATNKSKTKQNKTNKAKTEQNKTNKITKPTSKKKQKQETMIFKQNFKALYAVLLAYHVALSHGSEASYLVGVGKSRITDGARKLNLQGFADPSQKVMGVHDELYARAFAVFDKQATKGAVIVVMDNWSGTDRVKREVLARLDNEHLTEENFLLTATHSHAAPGGISDWKLYEHTPGGFDPHNFESVVVGVVDAITDALENIGYGNIYMNKGKFNSPGDQRSEAAYNANPESERNHFASNVDESMTLLKFTHLEGGQENTIGVLNWFAIHPTTLGQDYKQVSGDSKGYAEYLLEQEFGGDFVAAFANSNAGDVSGNIKYGSPTGKDPSTLLHYMMADGRDQYEAALSLLNGATTKLTGGVDYRYKRVNMGHVDIIEEPGARTWPGGLGLSFAAGSTEDGVPRISLAGSTTDSFDLREGITEDNMTAEERSQQLATITGMAISFGAVADNGDYVNGHLPKPLILRTGQFNPPLTPNVVPLQIIKLADLAIVAVPGEPTTMAGRRIKQTVKAELGVSHVAVAGYSNDYASYITTKEEYNMQHYEGASTLFGPYTLMAYQQEYAALAQAMKSGANVAIGPRFDTPSVPVMYRVTIRNMCNQDRRVRFFKNSDSWMWVDLDGYHTIPANSDYAYLVDNASLKRMKIEDSGKVVTDIKEGDQVNISSDCYNTWRQSYFPYHYDIGSVA